MDQETRYEAVLAEVRHYDTVSISLVGGIVAVVAGAFVLYEALCSVKDASFAFIGAIPILILLYMIYRRTSRYSNIARNFSAALEVDKGNAIDYGISTVYKHQGKTPYSRYSPSKSIWNIGIYALVFWLCCVLTVVLLVAFALAEQCPCK